LAAEVLLAQRSKYFVSHPLFSIIHTQYDNVYLGVCKAFEGNLFAQNDIVFEANHWCTALFVSAQGKYLLKSSYRAPVELHKPEWFSEACLFSKILHHSTLISETISDGYSLSPLKFAECVGPSPHCAMIVVKYAKELLSHLWEGEATDCPQGKYMVDDMLPKDLPEQVITSLTEEKESRKTMLVRQPSSRQPNQEEVQELISGIFKGTLSDAELIMGLPCVFTELDSEFGLYSQVNEHDELKRVICAILSVYWLLHDRYDSFVAAQEPSKRMSEALWAEWQEFVHYASLGEEMVHVLLVFLVIRGLSKSKAVARRMGLSERSPPNVILEELLEQQLLTSVNNFDDHMHSLLESVIIFHEKFILPQFLQAENLPYHVDSLKKCIASEGHRPFKCYLFALVAMMCGLLGSRSMHGSLFMDNNNGRNVLLGIRCLQNVSKTSTHAIYWSYVALRARLLNYSVETTSRLVLARLACLTRASSDSLHTLEVAWYTLSQQQQNALVDFFLADGICRKAAMFMFLPAYFEQSQKNTNIGLGLAFAVLAELVELLNRDLLKSGAELETPAVEINLTDLASFAGKVKSATVFKLVGEHSLFVQQGNSYHHLVTGDLWRQANLENVSINPTRQTVRNGQEVPSSFSLKRLATRKNSAAS
jgi:hypothetical protein